MTTNRKPWDEQDMERIEFTITTPDRLSLYGRCWAPAIQTRAAVCLVHGLGEHSGRFGHVAEAFNEGGYAFLTCDLRGHGRSEGKHGHAPNYETLMADISALLHEAVSRYPNLPCFLYGHSLGGNLVLHYVLREHPDLAGIIVTSPLFRPASKPPAWKMALLRAMYRLRPSLSLSSGLEDMALSRDINVVRTYRNDPLVHDRVSARLAIDMLSHGQWNLEHAAEFPLPLLLMHGDADRITSAAATREFAKSLGDRCTLNIWQGMFHELHNEPEKYDIITFVTDWLDRYS